LLARQSRPSAEQDDGGGAGVGGAGGVPLHVGGSGPKITEPENRRLLMEKTELGSELLVPQVDSPGTQPFHCVEAMAMPTRLMVSFTFWRALSDGYRSKFVTSLPL